MQRKIYYMFVLTVVLVLIPNVSKADEYTSSSYRVIEPTMFSTSFGTSTSFQVWGSLAQIGIGTSSATGFKLSSGSLFYPEATSPVVSATPGDTSIFLSWTTSEGFLGWTPSSYSIGQSTVTGGPYSYTTVGNVASSTIVGLTNGTPYNFVIVIKDIFGNAIASSSQITSTPVSTSTGSDMVVRGGGGGGGGNTSNAEVTVSGRAYPLSKVHILKDGQVALVTIAGPDSNFSATIGSLSGGDYIFSVYGEDKKGSISSPFTFPVRITSGVTTSIGGIFIAPTISVDKSEVKKGDPIAIFGQTSQNSDVTIQTNSNEEFFSKAKSDKDGIYLYNFDTSVLEQGDHSTKLKSAYEGEISLFSKEMKFIVGTKNVAAVIEKKSIPEKGDLNNDGRVNLVDFSILAFWYKKPLTETFKAFEKEKLNGDGKIDLVDFSIMAFNWTG